MTGIYRFADMNVAVTSQYPAVHALCAEYRTDAAPDFAVEISRSDNDRERAIAGQGTASDSCLETLAVYRAIAEKAPERGAFLFHGSALAVDGEGYVLAAPSGVGKSTHARLWRELLGERVAMINDDKPLIRVYGDGTAAVYGTPWDGKHRLSTNMSAPLRAVCVLERGEVNHIRPIPKAEALPALIRQTYRPRDPAALKATMALLDQMNVRLYRLRCNMEPSAAELSFSAMSGEE